MAAVVHLLTFEKALPTVPKCKMALFLYPFLSYHLTYYYYYYYHCQFIANLSFYTGQLRIYKI